MAVEALAEEGNFLHLYDFRVLPGQGDEFIALFNEFDYSDSNPMHKSAEQVKDGALCRDELDPDRFYLIGEWKSVEAHKEILKSIAAQLKPKFISLIEGGKFTCRYIKVVSSTPAEYLQRVGRK